MGLSRRDPVFYEQYFMSTASIFSNSTSEDRGMRQKKFPFCYAKSPSIFCFEPFQLSAYLQAGSVWSSSGKRLLEPLRTPPSHKRNSTIYPLGSNERIILNNANVCQQSLSWAMVSPNFELYRFNTDHRCKSYIRDCLLWSNRQFGVVNIMAHFPCLLSASRSVFGVLARPTIFWGLNLRFRSPMDTSQQCTSTCYQPVIWMPHCQWNSPIPKLTSNGP